MILARPISRWVGKIVQAVEPLAGHDKDTLFMTHGVRITFTDGDILLLKSDHYGKECYVSEHEPSESLNEVPIDG